MNVVIFQYRLLHYRVKLFEIMRFLCNSKGITLNIVYGQPSKTEELKNDTGTISWGTPVNNWFLHIGGRDLVWQPFPKELHNADLLIIMQENRILSNYPLLLKRIFRHTKVAYWGHGKNFQSFAPNGLREHWKLWLLDKVDWWFAYTEMTSSILIDNGFPNDSITCLNNAIDNEGFILDLENVGEGILKGLRSKLDLGEDAPLGLFCGSLYPDKRLDFLIESAKLIHDSLPQFHLVIIGDGPSNSLLHTLADAYPWIHPVGVQKGTNKAAYFKLAKVLLNPGAVGLHVLDAFCSGLPIFTTDNARHGPEITYLRHGINGFILPDSTKGYANAVISLLKDYPQYLRVSLASLDSSKLYTLQKMAENFVSGIENCLKGSAPER